MKLLIIWHRQERLLDLFILEMQLMSCQKMKIWDSICQRVEQTFGQMRWLFLKMRRILSLRMSLFVILQVMMQPWIIQVMLDILHQIKKLRKNLVAKVEIMMVLTHIHLVQVTIKMKYSNMMKLHVRSLRICGLE